MIPRVRFKGVNRYAGELREPCCICALMGAQLEKREGALAAEPLPDPPLNLHGPGCNDRSFSVEEAPDAIRHGETGIKRSVPSRFPSQQKKFERAAIPILPGPLHGMAAVKRRRELDRVNAPLMCGEGIRKPIVPERLPHAQKGIGE